MKEQRLKTQQARLSPLTVLQTMQSEQQMLAIHTSFSLMKELDWAAELQPSRELCLFTHTMLLKALQSLQQVTEASRFMQAIQLATLAMKSKKQSEFHILQTTSLTKIATTLCLELFSLMERTISTIQEILMQLLVKLNGMDMRQESLQ